MTNHTPFTVQIPQTDLDDLKARLERTRLPQAAPGDDWSYGTPNHYLAETVAYWRDEFDWSAQEKRLNEFPQYLTEIDGQTVHYLHVPSAVADAKPVLLVHTYPGSFADYLDVIGPLVDPEAHGGKAEDAVSVVVPSIPGFGFSTPLADGGWTMARVAKTFDSLMRELGYESYGVHGSDAGAMIARELGLLQPAGFLGLHVLQLFSFPSGDPAEFENLGPADYAALEFMQWFQSVGGYNGMNAARPQTIGAGPGRFAGRPAGVLGAVRVLRQRHQPGHQGSAADPGLALLADQHRRDRRPRSTTRRPAPGPSRRSTRRGPGSPSSPRTSRPSAPSPSGTTPAIEHWNTFPEGGHFAAMERPADVAADIRAFFAG